MMTDLRRVKDTVEKILERDTQARNSDSLLYLRVLELHGQEKHLDIHGMLMMDFLLNRESYGFPPFESVRRARQKVQRERPDLAPCDAVKAYRAENENGYFALAVDGGEAHAT